MKYERALGAASILAGLLVARGGVSACEPRCVRACRTYSLLHSPSIKVPIRGDTLRERERLCLWSVDVFCVRCWKRARGKKKPCGPRRGGKLCRSPPRGGRCFGAELHDIHARISTIKRLRGQAALPPGAPIIAGSGNDSD